VLNIALLYPPSWGVLDALCAPTLPYALQLRRPMLGDLSVGEVPPASIRAAGCLVRLDDK